MSGLEIKTRDKNFLSIKDLTSDLEISHVKWNSLFITTFNLFDNIYFNGERKWSMDADFDNTINYLSDRTFIDTRDRNFEILFRMKNSSMMYNRKLASNLWHYYEYPSFIFLDDKGREDALIQCCKKRLFIEDIVKEIEGLLIMYRSFEQDVLWIRGNVDIEKILDLVKI